MTSPPRVIDMAQEKKKRIEIVTGTVHHIMQTYHDSSHMNSTIISLLFRQNSKHLLKVGYTRKLPTHF